MQIIINLLKKLNIKYKNLNYYIEAFTHPTYLNEKQLQGNSYQKLEFLGDAIFEFVVSEFLYKNYPNADEGDLTFIRQNCVNSKAFANIARELKLGECLLLGNGEEKSGARDRDALLEDTLEAFIAAIYLDQGLEVCKPFVINLIKNNLKDTKDNKSVLQEFLHRSIEYRLESETGPAHNRTFVCSAVVDNIIYGIGEGKTKKAAEQEAAKKALEILAGK
jgi:ribonuclease-3